jgi:hypothetical protein
MGIDNIGRQWWEKSTVSTDEWKWISKWMSEPQEINFGEVQSKGIHRKSDGRMDDIIDDWIRCSHYYYDRFFFSLITRI